MTQDNLQKELDESINLFFWDPRNGRDAYCEKYKVVNKNKFIKDGNKVRYPRLLWLREDLYFVLWKPIRPGTQSDYPYGRFRGRFSKRS